MHVWSFLSCSLQTLSLDGNHLSSLPEELGGLFQLNSLGLSFNNFSHIPAVLERLNAVDKLAMAGNRVEGLELCTLLRMSHLRNIDLREVTLFSSNLTFFHLCLSVLPVLISPATVWIIRGQLIIYKRVNQCQIFSQIMRSDDRHFMREEQNHYPPLIFFFASLTER